MISDSVNLDQFTSFKSPIGWVVLEGDALGIAKIWFSEENVGKSAVIDACLQDGATQLQEYFAKQRRTFELKLKPVGTIFQKEVWTVLQTIPFGITRSYLDVALAMKNEKATRAVGAANGQNKLNIVVPCHRVIGSDGSLTGYGGELWRKEWLLNHEREQVYGKQESLF